jgi:mercuric ion binding protein
MKTSLIKITAVTASILMATGLTACSKSEVQQSTGQNSEQISGVQVSSAQQATASFAIDKMTCATCPISVRKAMKRVDGVKSVKVDFKTKIATVVYDPAKTTPAQIAAASTKVGYPASETIG